MISIDYNADKCSRTSLLDLDVCELLVLTYFSKALCIDFDQSLLRSTAIPIWRLYLILVNRGPCIVFSNSILSQRTNWNQLNHWPSFLCSSRSFSSLGGKVLPLPFFSQ